MANKFDRLQYDSEYYFPRDSLSFRVDGTQSSKTSTWLGALPAGVDDYFDGLTIDYFLPYDSGTANVTLNLGGKGAKFVYYNASGHALTHVTTEGLANTLIRLTYVIKAGVTELANGAWIIADGIVTGSGIKVKTESDTITEVQYINGTAPSLSFNSEGVAATFISDWDAGSVTSMSVSEGRLKITTGRVPNLVKSETNVKGVTSWDPGTMTTLSDKATKTFLTKAEIAGEDD